jgi:uncharacterized delta-60 repeat protein
MVHERSRGWLARSALALIATCSVAVAADGDLDPGFGDGGVARIVSDGTDTIAMVPMRAMALPDGKLLFSGAHHYLPPENPPFEPEIRGMLMRMNADGTPDASFGGPTVAGAVVLPQIVPNTRIQSIDAFARLDDGSIVGTGTGVGDGPTQGFVVKLDAGGALDAAFGDGGVTLLPDVNLHAIAVDSTGRIVVCGERFLDFVSTSAVARLDAAGHIDASFGDGGLVLIPWSDETQNGYLSDLALTPDGGIVVAGRFSAYGPGLNSDFAIAKVGDDGALDMAFGDGGTRVFHDESGTSMANGIDRLALLDDGRLVFAGYRAAGASNQRGAALGRLESDGTTDATFGDPATPGYLYVDVAPDGLSVDASGLAIQPDGKLVVAMTYFSASEDERFFAWRATADGALDTAFADGGIFRFDPVAGAMSSDVRSLTVQQDGAIVIGGRAVLSFDPPLTDMAVVRLLGSASTGDAIFADGFDG